MQDKVGLADTSPGGDPDGDGMPNLVEFVLGTDPRDRQQQQAKPALSVSNGNRRFEFVRHAGSKFSTDQIVQWTSDMKTWTDIPVTWKSSSGITVETSAGQERVSVTLPSTSGPIFTRLKVATR